jgi:hypothetical protein
MADPVLLERPQAVAPPRPASPPRLEALEWAVVALAERDSLASLKEPSRLSQAIAQIFGTPLTTRLADDRLEALRRLAVHAWRRGYAIPVAEIRNFYRAGFTPDQLELVVTSIERGRAGTERRIAA